MNHITKLNIYEKILNKRVNCLFSYDAFTRLFHICICLKTRSNRQPLGPFSLASLNSFKRWKKSNTSLNASFKKKTKIFFHRRIPRTERSTSSKPWHLYVNACVHLPRLIIYIIPTEWRTSLHSYIFIFDQIKCLIVCVCLDFRLVCAYPSYLDVYYYERLCAISLVRSHHGSWTVIDYRCFHLA